MVDVINASLSGYPLEGLGEGVEYKWCRSQSKWQDPVEEEVALPAHLQGKLGADRGPLYPVPKTKVRP